jgi:hypothetical protein
VEQFLVRTSRQEKSRRYWLFGRRIGQTVYNKFGDISGRFRIRKGKKEA